MLIQTDYIFFFFIGTFVASFIFLLYFRKKYPGQISRMTFLALIFLYFLGLVAANWQGKLMDSEIREHLRGQVEAIARTINKDHIKALAFSGSDKNKPEFRELCTQMRSYKNALTNVLATQDITIYSMIKRENAILFGPESIEPGHRYASPPGTEYQLPTLSVKQIFTNGQAFTEGPYTDEYSTFLSSYAPVFDPATGKILLVVGMDIGFTEVQAAISHQSLYAYLCAVLLVCVFLLGTVQFAMAPHMPKKFSVTAGGINVIASGLALTLILALVLHQNGIKSRNAVFTQVSEPEANSLCKAFMNLRDYQVTAMIRYFVEPKIIDRATFHSLLSPMFRFSGRQTRFGWIIPVANSQKEKMEIKAREEGMNDFTIWQPDSNGKKIAASGRNTYFPFWYFEPHDGNNPVPGYDPGYDPMILETIDKAIKTGLPAATDPVVFPADKSKQMKILVFQPVFTGKANNRALQGFIVAVVSPETFLQKAISYDNAAKSQTIVDLCQIYPDLPPRLLACTLGEKNSAHLERHHDLSTCINDDRAKIYPVFVFDKAYAALIFPGSGSFAAMPVYAGWIAVAIGILLTFLITALTVLLSRRNESLENLVEARTGELKKSEAELRELNATKDKFFSIIAHDLRSPFHAFLGFTQIMVEELDNMTLEEIKKIVVSMRKSATNVYSLLENLLEWSMLQRGITPYNPISIPLAVKAKENIELLIGSAQKKEIEVRYEIPDNIMVFADVHILETVIRNLFSNAVKFTHRRGSITLSAKQSESNSVEISISDSGIGMNTELAGKLFRLNEQTNRKGTEGEASIGLGLLICKDFIEKHGGKIWVDSKEGAGSTFHFTLPMKNEP